MSAINFLMPPETRVTGHMAGDDVEVESRGFEVARRMLSDGAQSYMAWSTPT
jgi:hypothetical protein